MEGHVIAGVRPSDLTRQTKALKRVGCAAVYSDTASGKSMAGRPELAAALEDIDEGEELVIAEWDRATRSMWDGLQIIKTVIDAKATVRCSIAAISTLKPRWGAASWRCFPL